LRREAAPLDAPATPTGEVIRPEYTQDGDKMQHNRHISSVQWEQAIGYAREVCARIFRDGGTPRAALTAFGLSEAGPIDWSTVVDRIALALCAPQLCARPQQRKAA
jgi:hypothetical protein